MTILFEWWDHEHGIILECSVRYRPETMDALRARPETRNIRVNEGAA